MDKNKKDFVVFILTHGRPNNIYTLAALKKAGYTGEIVIVIDNEDKTAQEYYKNYGKMVYQFDKKAIASTFDEMDNFKDRRSIVYARNACFDIAKKLGYTYFMELDDDYVKFQHRFNKENEFSYVGMSNMDAVLDAMLKYYKSIPALSIALAQGGDYIGGSKGSGARLRMKRKCMNTFICSTERPFQFFGRINEDVNTYTSLASRGGLFLTVMNVAIVQVQTQSNEGGMTDIYLDSGTYRKSFYSVMAHPSSVTIRLMGSEHRRLHHSVKWNNTCPVIIHEKHKKV